MNIYVVQYLNMGRSNLENKTNQKLKRERKLINITEKYSITNRSSRPEVFLGKGILKICSKFTGEHSCRSLISTKLLKHTLTRVLSCKFAAYFQNTFSSKHLRRAASVSSNNKAKFKRSFQKINFYSP